MLLYCRCTAGVLPVYCQGRGSWLEFRDLGSGPKPSLLQASTHTQSALQVCIGAARAFFTCRSVLCRVVCVPVV
jgi:hypothetical protein